MLKRIKVYGRLKKFLKWDSGVFEADVRSIADVMSFLKANWPEIKGHMSKQHYKVIIGERDFDIDEINDPIGQTEEIKIVPVMVGAKGVWKVVAGVALVAGAIMLGPVGATYLGGLVTAGGGSAAIIGGVGATIMAGVGTALAFGGVAEMLTPPPELPEMPGAGENSIDPQINFSFSGVQNVSRSGIPVSLVYGYEVIVGSVIVSNGVDTVQIRGTA